MALSAVGGAYLALKIAAGTEFSDTLLQRKITEGFSEKIARVRATQGDVLELAVLESTLTFTLEDEWKNVPADLGKSVAKIGVPAVFRFFVKISEPITFSSEEKDGEIRCTVIAPKLRPVLPVAFDTSRMTRERDIGVLRFNREEMTDALNDRISMRLVLSAKNHAKTALVRDAARTAFEKFVREWLGEIRELRERGIEKISVRVFFEDEVPPPDDAVPAEKESAVPVSV